MRRLLKFFDDPVNSIFLIVVLLIVALTSLFIIFGNNTDFNKTELEYYKTYYFENGKVVGRNAMLEYLHKTGELKDTSINLDINQYMKIEERIEDSILHNKMYQDE